MKKIFWIIFTVIIAAFVAGNISLRAKEKKNAPVEQYIEDAFITVTAPPMLVNEKSANTTKEKLQNKIVSLAFYQSSYKKADYTVIYAKYLDEVDFEKGIQSVINAFKNDGFIYETKENEVSGNKGAYIEGTFERKGVKYGIKEQLIKQKTNFWQLLTVYPYSKKNADFADKFIQSAVLDEIKSK
jgi:hypothetical protein